MPFKTKYGTHYHETEGCCGATEPCSAAGLEPCSICCAGAKGQGGAGGGAAGGIGAGPGAGDGDYSVDAFEVSTMTNAITKACDDGDQVVLADGSIIQFREAHEIGQNHDGYVLEDPETGSFVRFVTPEDLAEAARQLESGEADLGSGSGWGEYKTRSARAMALAAAGAKSLNSSTAPDVSPDAVRGRIHEYDELASVASLPKPAQGVNLDDVRRHYEEVVFRKQDAALQAARRRDPSERLDSSGLPASFTPGVLAAIGHVPLVDDDGEEIPPMKNEDVARYIRHAVTDPGMGDVDMDTIKKTIAVDRRMHAYAKKYASGEIARLQSKLDEMKKNPNVSWYTRGQTENKIRRLQRIAENPPSMWDVCSGNAFDSDTVDGVDGEVLETGLSGDAVYVIDTYEIRRQGGMLPMGALMRKVAESGDSSDAFDDFFESVEDGYPTEWMLDEMLELGTVYEAYPSDNWRY